MVVANPPVPFLSAVNAPGYVIAWVASIGVVVGSLGPWAEAGSIFASGIQVDDGYITLISGVVAALALLVAAVSKVAWTWLATVLAGSIAAIVGFWDLISGIRNFAEIDSPLDISVGWGLWVVCVSALLLVAGCFVATVGASSDIVSDKSLQQAVQATRIFALGAIVVAAIVAILAWVCLIFYVW